MSNTFLPNVGLMVGDSGSGGVPGLVPAPPAGAAAAGKFLTAGATWTVPSGSVPTAMTITRLTTGSSTYFTPSAPTPLYLRLRMVGGGGGGSGSGVNGTGTAGGNGGNTVFGTTLLLAFGGSGHGGAGGNSANGGGATILGVGPIQLMTINGGQGGAGNAYPSTLNGIQLQAGGGGLSPFCGGAGPVNTGGGSTPNNNTGSGGAGAGSGSVATASQGGGGGAGGYLEVLITSPGATYSFSIGASGTAGPAGTGGGGNTGAPGALGFILIEEHYQ